MPRGSENKLFFVSVVLYDLGLTRFALYGHQRNQTLLYYEVKGLRRASAPLPLTCGGVFDAYAYGIVVLKGLT